MIDLLPTAEPCSQRVEPCSPRDLQPEIGSVVVALARTGHFSVSEIWGGLDLFANGASLRTLRYFARRLRKSSGRSSEYAIELTPESLAGIIADYLLAVGGHALAMRVLERLRGMFGISPAVEGQSP